MPVSYKGRFRPMEAYAQLWLYDFYHASKIKSSDANLFIKNNQSIVELIWKMNFLGHLPWDNAPLFWIHQAEVKNLLSLDIKRDRFSYNELSYSIFENEETNLKLMHRIVVYYFIKNYLSPFNRSKNEKLELSELTKDLWVTFKDNDIIIESAPKSPPWNFLKPGLILAKDSRENIEAYVKKEQVPAEEILNLLSLFYQYKQISPPVTYEIDLKKTLDNLQKLGVSPTEISQIIENQFPLANRLNQAGTLLKALPSHSRNGEWFPLNALKLQVYDPEENRLAPIKNFTAYSDEKFDIIQSLYLQIDSKFQSATQEEIDDLIHALSIQLTQSYQSLAGFPYQNAANKFLTYPSLYQLHLETWYYQYPIISLSMFLYAFAMAAFLLGLNLKKQLIRRIGLSFLILAFISHTIILAIRCYILERPPVSNMFETIIYVPWIAVLAGFILYFVFKSSAALIASSIVALGLLSLLQLTNLNSSFENVQAVLDSQYWLIIHVLMVVGSYGVFFLSGILGHIYLGIFAFQKQETLSAKLIGKCILQTMYLGVALLIPGTILGGVWAAESWGRFWDWDPKESWAFISSCIYLIWIHAYNFHYVHNFGLAFGSIIGLLAISFTWYGVNYILGTGLHSYGFGSGGEIYYYWFIGLELAFLIFVFFKVKFKANKDRYNQINSTAKLS